MNFESANLPYRDFVAKENYLNIIPSNNIKNIIINENIFFGNNEFTNNIKLLKILKDKHIKLILLSKGTKELSDKYNLDDLFDEIKEFYEIKKNTNDSIFITDSKELIPNIKSIIINKYYNYKTNNYDKLVEFYYC